MATTTVSFAAMGTDVDVVVTSAKQSDAAVAYAKNRIESLEQRWSRFIDTSEVSTVNQNIGRLVKVSNETLELAKLALAAMDATDGVFNPFVRADLAGYKQNFADIPKDVDTELVPAEGNLEISEDLSSLQLTHGRIDFGGIGKGFAADLVAEELQQYEPEQVIVNIGGDMRVITNHTSSSTPIELDLGSETIGITIKQGAVATSSILKRRWKSADGEVSHLRNPTTGGELASDIESVSVVSDTAAKAEVLVKLCLAGGLDDLELIAERYGCSGAAMIGGKLTTFGQLSDFQAHSSTQA